MSYIEAVFFRYEFTTGRPAGVFAWIDPTYGRAGARLALQHTRAKLGHLLCGKCKKHTRSCASGNHIFVVSTNIDLANAIAREILGTDDERRVQLANVDTSRALSSAMRSLRRPGSYRDGGLQSAV